MRNSWEKLAESCHESGMAYARKCGTLSSTLEIVLINLEIEVKYSDNQELTKFLEKQIKFIQESLDKAENEFNNRVT